MLLNEILLKINARLGLNFLEDDASWKIQQKIIDLQTIKMIVTASKLNDNLRTLSFSHSQMKLDVIAEIVEFLKENTQLKELCLSWNNIDASSAQLLSVGLASNTHLTSLCLSHNQIGAMGSYHLAQALLDNPQSSLERLDLTSNQLLDAGVQYISNALKTNHTLLILHLSENNIGTFGALALSEALKVNNSLEELYLSQSYDTYDEFLKLYSGLKLNKSLHTLDISKNKMGENESVVLAKIIETNSNLKILNISGNLLGSRGLEILSKAVAENDSIEELNISNNRIIGNELQQFFPSLQYNTSLEILNLSENNIGDIGISILSNSLIGNHSLEELLLSDSNISDIGANILSSTLKTIRQLEVLNLSRNIIGASGAIALSGFLQTTTNLRELNLSHNKISSDGVKAIAKALATNISLESLDISKNGLCFNSLIYFVTSLSESNISLTELTADSECEDILEQGTMIDLAISKYAAQNKKIAEYIDHIVKYLTIENYLEYQSSSLNTTCTEINAKPEQFVKLFMKALCDSYNAPDLNLEKLQLISANHLFLSILNQIYAAANDLGIIILEAAQNFVSSMTEEEKEAYPKLFPKFNILSDDTLDIFDCLSNYELMKKLSLFSNKQFIDCIIKTSQYKNILNLTDDKEIIITSLANYALYQQWMDEQKSIEENTNLLKKSEELLAQAANDIVSNINKDFFHYYPPEMPEVKKLLLFVEWENAVKDPAFHNEEVITAIRDFYSIAHSHLDPYYHAQITELVGMAEYS